MTAQWWHKLKQLSATFTNVNELETENEIKTHLTKKDLLLSELGHNGKKLLHYIAEINSSSITQFCIDAGCDVNEFSDLGITPIIIAIDHSNVDTVKTLLEAGAIRNSYYYRKNSGPLFTAIEKGHRDMIKLLLNDGVDDHTKTSAFLHCVNLLISGKSNNGLYEIMELLIKAGANINAEDDNGNTPLHLAVGAGCDDAIEFLLKANAQVNVENVYKRIPLQNFQLSEMMRVGPVERLIEVGSKIEGADIFGNTALHYAVASMSLSAVKLLLSKGASVNVVNRMDFDPLSYSFFTRVCFNSNERIRGDIVLDEYIICIITLLDNKLDLNRMNKNGWTPLYVALQNGHDSKIISLLLDRGATFDYDNSIVQTTIRGNRNQKTSRILLRHMAMHNPQKRLNFDKSGIGQELQDFYLNCLDEIRRLNECSSTDSSLLGSSFSMDSCKTEAEFKNRKTVNSSFWNTLEELINKFYIDENSMQQKIIKHLTMTDTLPELYDHQGNNVLHYLTRIKNSFIIKICIVFECNVNTLNNEKNPPLAIAVERNNLEVAKALLDGGAIHDIGFFNNYKGPLHLAVEKGHLEMVKLLIDHHVNVNAFDRSFRTPLHVVCSLGTLKNANYIEIVKELIKAGADVNAKDLYENTPLHLVSKNCLNDVIDLLLTAGAEVNSKNNKDNSPLHLVSNKQVSTNTLQRLVKAGSETNVANCYGKTPLHQLATHLSPKMLEILLKNGALANIYDYHDLDAMSYVIDNCKYNMPKKKLGESLNAIRLLIDNGSDINRINKHGFSTLYLALFNNCHSKIVSFLLRCGSIIDFDSIMIQKTIKQKEISESSRLLIKHAALYDVQCRKDMLLNFSLDKLNKQQQELYAHCKKELLFMKMMIIEGTVSLFDFLTDKDVSAYVQDENILKVFNINHITLSFPNYSEMLSDRFSSEQLKLENSQKK